MDKFYSTILIGRFWIYDNCNKKKKSLRWLILFRSHFICFYACFYFYPLQMVSSQIVPFAEKRDTDITHQSPCTPNPLFIDIFLGRFNFSNLPYIRVWFWQLEKARSFHSPWKQCGNMSEVKKICACIGQPFSRRNLSIKSTIGSDRASRRAFYRGRQDGEAFARALKIRVLICSAPLTLRTSGCSRRRRLSASLSGFQLDNRRCKRDLGDDNAVGGG